MRLLVIRHGIAEDEASSGRDADRALTPRGRERLKEELRGLRALELSVAGMLHSPWRRAAQTAEVLAPLVEDGRAPEACAHLAAPPGEELLAALRGEALALVGHEPWLSQLVTWLASGRRGGAALVEMKKGAVAWLEGEPRPGSMQLAALLPPRTLRRLGGADA